MARAERETATQILEAASRLFAERGYKGTTTRAIAQEAGVNEVTLFRRFGNKRGILEALGASWAEHMAGFVVTAMPDADDTRATLESLARIEVRQAMHAGATAMRLALDARFEPDVAAVMGVGPGDNFAGVVAYLADRQRAGDLRSDMDPRAMAEAFFALTSQLVLSRQVLGGAGTDYELDVDAATAQTFELFWRGVAA